MAISCRYIQGYEKKILELKEQGLTLKEICEQQGSTYKHVHNFITRYNANQRNIARKLCNIIFVIINENGPYLPTPSKNPQILSCFFYFEC